jgi:hypothetical protein
MSISRLCINYSSFRQIEDTYKHEKEALGTREMDAGDR